ncbi:hypothetical protein Pcinc_009595 [Petrolisthes cinctipes]|uniref:Uncharacterized protein n=1 Tax=Petrolisthes cinctipes TaxID=88211 RepID=A0AAE1G6H5_PETCI|nr:hypothetical protein Pcinc_009595 [Petrolisthes cinctipes]
MVVEETNDTVIGSINTPNETDLTKIKKEIESHIKVGQEAKEKLLNLLASFRHVIALPGEPLGENHQVEHQIKIKTGIYPVYVPAYRLPHSQREIVEEAVQEMLHEGVIEPSNSPWNAPLFL